jgi:flagellar biosynthesis chaperone FliJ
MRHLEKKANRLNPVIEDRQAKFDKESEVLNAVRRKRIETVAAMRAKQTEYMSGVNRLNEERGTSNRLMLEALEIGLDSVKSNWMKLYQAVVDLEREEKGQIEVMSQAHRDLEAIKTLQNKYKVESHKEIQRHEQKALDEHSLRKFAREP